MKEPSVVAMHESSAIASASQSSFPTSLKESQSQVHPHSNNTSQNVSGRRGAGGAGVQEISDFVIWVLSRTEQNDPTSSIG